MRYVKRNGAEQATHWWGNRLEALKSGEAGQDSIR